MKRWMVRPCKRIKYQPLAFRYCSFCLSSSNLIPHRCQEPPSISIHSFFSGIAKSRLKIESGYCGCKTTRSATSSKKTCSYLEGGRHLLLSARFSRSSTEQILPVEAICAAATWFTRCSIVIFAHLTNSVSDWLRQTNRNFSQLSYIVCLLCPLSLDNCLTDLPSKCSWYNCFQCPEVYFDFPAIFNSYNVVRKDSLQRKSV